MTKNIYYKCYILILENMLFTHTKGIESLPQTLILKFLNENIWIPLWKRLTFFCKQNVKIIKLKPERIISGGLLYNYVRRFIIELCPVVYYIIMSGGLLYNYFRRFIIKLCPEVYYRIMSGGLL